MGKKLWQAANRDNRKRVILNIRFRTCLLQCFRIGLGLLTAVVWLELFCIGANAAYDDYMLICERLAKILAPEKPAVEVVKKGFAFFKK